MEIEPQLSPLSKGQKAAQVVAVIPELGLVLTCHLHPQLEQRQPRLETCWFDAIPP